jgi:hypothetical protein
MGFQLSSALQSMLKIPGLWFSFQESGVSIFRLRFFEDCGAIISDAFYSLRGVLQLL